MKYLLKLCMWLACAGCKPQAPQPTQATPQPGAPCAQTPSQKVKAYFGRGISKLNDIGEAPVHEAIARGDMAGLQLALTHPHLKIDLATASGDPALHCALQRGDELGRQMAALLLEQGADTNSTNAHGQSALHLAAAKGDLLALELLLQGQGTALNKRDGVACGHTPLMWAVQQGHVEAAQLLMRQKGIDLAVTYAQTHQTLRYKAAEGEHDALVRALLCGTKARFGCQGCALNFEDALRYTCCKCKAQFCCPCLEASLLAQDAEGPAACPACQQTPFGEHLWAGACPGHVPQRYEQWREQRAKDPNLPWPAHSKETP